MRNPITRSDLLAGALQITVDGGASGTFIATVVDEDGSNAVQVGGDTLWYINPFTGSVSELELISAETGVTGYDIVDVRLYNVPTNFGYYLSGNKAYLAAKLLDGTTKILSFNNLVPYGSYNDFQECAEFEFDPSPYSSSADLHFVNTESVDDAPLETVAASLQEEAGTLYVAIGDTKSEITLSVGDESPLPVYGAIE